MPELPEVETIKRDLAGYIENQKITGLNILDSKLIEGTSSAQLKKLVLNCRILKVIRRAKFLIWELSNGKALIFHLRLNGQLIFTTHPPKYSKIIFNLAKGKVVFIDRRRLARVKISDNWRENKSIKNLGPEPFSKEFNPLYLARALKGRKANIKNLLLDQKLISGIGNIYDQEALFLSHIRPLRLGGSLKKKEINLLYENIRKVLKKAISRRGSSVNSYVDGVGKEGKAHLDHFVYQRASKPCLKCKAILQNTKISGRGTVWCSKCQK